MYVYGKVKELVTQLYLTLCDPMESSLPGSSVHGILQARILEWVFSSPGDFPYPGTEPRSPALQADSLPFEPPGKPIYMPSLVATVNSVWLRPVLTQSTPSTISSSLTLSAYLLSMKQNCSITDVTTEGALEMNQCWVRKPVNCGQSLIQIKCISLG